MSILEVEDVPQFLRGDLKDHMYPYLRANWISRDVLKLNKHVQKPDKYRGVLHNPRETGQWCFTFDKTSTASYLAYDVLHCSGIHNCTLNLSGKCEASLKLTYFYNSGRDKVNVKVFTKDKDLSHGPQFLPNPASMKLGGDVRAIITEMAEMHLKPLPITFNIANKALKSGAQCDNGSVVPTISQVRDIIKYEKRLATLREELDSMWKKFPDNVIFPHEEDFFSLNAHSLLVMVFRSGPVCHSHLLKAVSDENSVVGLDAQYRLGFEGIRYAHIVHHLCINNAQVMHK